MDLARCMLGYFLCSLSSADITKHVVKLGHYRPASKTPSERRFAGGPIVARDLILAGHIICRGRPLISFAVSRAANSIDPDQAEPTLFAKIFIKCSKTSFSVISVFSALGVLFISKM